MVNHIYFHMPFCKQKCLYCDFATFSQYNELQFTNYLDVLVREYNKKSTLWPLTKPIRTIYFGGGTPSLYLPDQLKQLFQPVLKSIRLDTENEITMEINPSKDFPDYLPEYIELGINRFSVGVQTFDPNLLKRLNREHSVEETEKTLTALEKNNLNFSLDLIYGLPGQTLDSFLQDLKRALSFSPKHLSLYNLTLIADHPLNQNRPTDSTEVDMFFEGWAQLNDSGLIQYELSNFAVPGFESKHNLSYWSDRPYLSFGSSAHSYIKSNSNFGVRFWNPSTLEAYERSVEFLENSIDSNSYIDTIPAKFKEQLSLGESMTDYCYTQLRKRSGLSYLGFEKKYGNQHLKELKNKANPLIESGYLTLDNGNNLSISHSKQLLSNHVYRHLQF